MTRRKSGKRRWRWLVGGLLAVLLVLGLLVYPTNYYAEVPGSAESLKPYVTVAGRKDTAKGSYMLTTVGIVGPASPAVLLWAKCQPYAEILSKSELMGDDDSATYNLLQELYIKSAANGAVQAAFAAAGKKTTLKHLGIYVMSILKASPFKGQLKLGDTITALDGRHYGSADAYVKAIQRRKVGSKLTLTYLRKGKTHQASGRLMRLPNSTKAGIGITLTEHTTISTTPKVTIDAGSIGGPSAGLMFAVQVYTELTNQQWRRGQKIAGTGTIDGTGTVGQIGGIDKKVYMAAKEGASVFFAPDQPATKALLKADPSYENNYAVAKRTAKQLQTKMVIVPVKTLQDALTYLKHR